MVVFWGGMSAVSVAEQCEAVSETVENGDPTSSPPNKYQNKCDWFSWPKMMGDWGGARTELADNGIEFNLRLINFYQGVTSGGKNTNFAYGGKLDYILNFDGKKLGLWDGLFVTMHAETQFGNSIFDDVSALALPNTSMLYPLPNYRGTAITGLLVQQALSKNFVLTAGKVNAIDLWSMVYPRVGGGVDGFSNANLIASAVPWLRFVNLSVLGAGGLVLRDDGQIQGGVLVFDTHNSTTTTGIPKLFSNGAGVMGLWRFFFDVNDKPGRLLFVVGGSTRTYVSFDKTDWGLNLADRSILIGKKTGALSAAVYYDQVLWEKPDNDKRNIWLYTGCSISDGNPSFGKWSGFASVEATGLLPGRENDRMGVGVFYNRISSELKNLTSNMGDNLQDTWGTEAYYNIEVTPWFHLTPNLQVVESQRKDYDPAVIVGLRAVMDF